VSSNLLAEFSTQLAAGQKAMQAEYGVRNGNASWRTRLMVIAFSLFHTVRSLGREALGLSCGLRGNGMCFSIPLLRTVQPRAFSIVEDIEYGILLATAGVRVAYVHAAKVLGDMPSTGGAARSQRERWESGRWQLARRYLPSLLRTAVRRRDPVALDLAVDLLVPPLTWLAMATVIGALAAVAGVIRFDLPGSVVFPWVLSLSALGLYVARGIHLAGGGARAYADLLLVPVYAAWKLTLVGQSARRDRNEWVRTARQDVL
jgi:cellulose synthase/poly-beta-1,6-N-acetylglucosamine synthase-like glycosyltransferase